MLTDKSDPEPRRELETDLPARYELDAKGHLRLVSPKQAGPEQAAGESHSDTKDGERQPFLMLDPDNCCKVEDLNLDAVKRIEIKFARHTDGRGFSLARKLKADFICRSCDRPLLIAVGQLIPDQAHMAFQSGFDLIEISQDSIETHGELAWRRALDVAACDLYWQQPRETRGFDLDGASGSGNIAIWQKRLERRKP